MRWLLGVARRAWISRSAASRSLPATRVSKPADPVSSERSALWIDSAKVRPIAITSPRLHLRTQLVGGARKLLKREARNLGHDVIDGRLEAGRSLARDVVGDLVQAVA